MTDEPNRDDDYEERVQQPEEDANEHPAIALFRSNLVEPSVPVSKIRKVFEQLDFSEPSARARRRLAAAFQMLTGEPLRKDAT